MEKLSNKLSSLYSNSKPGCRPMLMYKEDLHFLYQLIYDGMLKNNCLSTKT